MTTRRSRWLVTVLLLVCGVALTGRGVSGQFRYWSGQNVVPVFEGWERNPDGSFNFVFGYFNRNYEETLDILVGPDNNLEPGGPDQGQPTFFAAARQKFIFRVRVPKDWPTDKRLVWTLTVRGKTEKANAFLLPEWEMNSQVMALNGGGGGGGGIDEDYNLPPVITFARPLSVAFPAPRRLSRQSRMTVCPNRERPGAAAHLAHCSASRGCNFAVRSAVACHSARARARLRMAKPKPSPRLR